MKSLKNSLRRGNKRWDRQIKADAEAGKLDQLAEEALREIAKESSSG
jgi:hypothetical protein